MNPTYGKTCCVISTTELFCVCSSACVCYEWLASPASVAPPVEWLWNELWSHSASCTTHTCPVVNVLHLKQMIALLGPFSHKAMESFKSVMDLSSARLVLVSLSVDVCHCLLWTTLSDDISCWSVNRIHKYTDLLDKIVVAPSDEWYEMMSV